jgi:hypothetical protein
MSKIYFFLKKKFDNEKQVSINKKQFIFVFAKPRFEMQLFLCFKNILKKI